MNTPRIPRGPNAVESVRIITSELERFLRKTRLRQIYIADSSVAPPPLAYVTHFPRLSLPLEGWHSMELPLRGQLVRVAPKCGQAIFVPGHAWDRPDWTNSVKVLTFLLGSKQIGISLVTHPGGNESRAVAVKTSVASAHDVPARNILNAIGALIAEEPGALAKSLMESLLYSCLHLLQAPETHKARKATRTYEKLCLYVQENFQNDITRESVARRMGIAPAHVSRLFRCEGLVRFNDYVNLVRVNRAKFILANYRVPLKEVAANCGYADVAYFCRVFKRFAKATPTEYQDRGAAMSQL